MYNFSFILPNIYFPESFYSFRLSHSILHLKTSVYMSLKKVFHYYSSTQNAILRSLDVNFYTISYDLVFKMIDYNIIGLGILLYSSYLFLNSPYISQLHSSIESRNFCKIFTIRMKRSLSE